jgi:DNA-binding transcriptional ArsR family regulator
MLLTLHERPQSRERFLERRFEEDYPAYQYILVEFLVAHLSDISRPFKGDLQQMLVLAVVGQVYLQWTRACRKQGSVPSQRPPALASISASRLSDCTGIPRETVRRKLVLLQHQGLVDRAPDGRWRLTPANEGMTTARQRFAHLERTAIERTACMIARLENLADGSRM